MNALRRTAKPSVALAASEKKTDPKDPRFRGYRMAMYGIYLVITVGFCISLIYQVYSSTRDMTYGTKQHPTNVITVRECVDGAESLFKGLETKRTQMGAPPNVTTADQRWLEFRRDWVERFRALEAQCALDSTTRGPLKELFERLERVADLYTTHAVQYAGHVGPGADELAAKFAELRKSPELGKLP